MFKLKVVLGRAAAVAARWLLVLACVVGSGAFAQSNLRWRHSCSRGLADTAWDVSMPQWLRFQRNCVSGAVAFEFANAAGVGMGSVACPSPNWLPYSEQLNTAPWGSAASGVPNPGLPVVTADAALSPTGTLTADRIDFGATSGTGYGIRTQAVNPASGDRSGVYTFGCWVKGVSGSGTVYLSMTQNSGAVGGYTTGTCNYNASSWTQCSTPPRSMAESLYDIESNIGVDRRDLAQVAQSAQSVYVWGCQLSSGTTLAPYLQTGASAAVYTPVSSGSTPLTFTRTSFATCAKQGFASTGIQNADVSLIPAGAPRIETTAMGGLGLLLEPASTNIILQSKAFDNAAWTKVNGVAAAPTVTANYATAPDGSPTADRVQFPALTGVTQYTLLRQTALTVSGGVATASVYVKGTSGSGTVWMSATLATGGTPGYPCYFNATTWTRCAYTFTSASNADGFDIGANNYLTGPGNAPASDVLLWGAQLENNELTSFIPTSSVAVTRTVENPAHFDLGTKTTSVRSLAANVEFESIGAAQGKFGITPVAAGVIGVADVLSSASPRMAAIINGRTLSCFANGVPYAVPVGGVIADRIACNISTITGGNLLTATTGNGTTVSTAPAVAANWRYVTLGTWDGSTSYTVSPIIISQICIDTVSGSCSRTAANSPRPFFEFAPSDGTGLTATACSPANWVANSEAFDSWILNASVTNPTVTANATTGPTGTATADRVDFPATGAAQFSFVYSNNSYANPWITGTPAVFAVWVKGVSGSGTLDLCHAGGGACAPCSYTSTAWTQCSLVANPWVSIAMTIGNCGIGNGGVARSAQSVYLWGAQFNPATTTLGAYAATPSGPAGPTVSGAKGEPLTLSRGSTATCLKTTGTLGAYTTTGIANGDLVLMASAQPRIVYNRTGLLGLLLENAATNYIIQSQAIDNAAWTKGATGSGVTPTVTADYAIAPDGTQTADRVQFSSCAGTVGQSIIFETLGLIGGVGQSVFLRGTGGSGNVSLCSGTIPGSCTVCPFVSTSWTRCTRTAAAAGAAGYFVIGCNNDTTNFAGASDTGAADVLVWGAQHEVVAAGAGVNGLPTSYIPTTASAVTRAQEVASFSLGNRTFRGLSLGTTVSYVGHTGDSGWLGFTGQNTLAGLNDLIGYPGIGQVSLFLGSVSRATTPVTGFVTGNMRVTGGYLGNDTLGTFACRDGMCVTSTVATAFSWFIGTTLYVGEYNTPAPGTHMQDGIYSRVCFDDASGRCIAPDPEPVLEFATTSGLGMGTACAGTVITGTKGEALATPRGSTATCTKTAAGGLSTTGIVNGDLVTLANDTPRVEYDSTGKLGLLVEESRTNFLLWSQDLTNAIWTKEFSVPNPGSVTADAAVAPDGTLTADRFVCAGGAGNCRIFQAPTTSNNTYRGSFYIRGTSGSGVIYMSGLGSGGTTSCSYVADSWTRCSFSTTIAATTNYLEFGCEAGQWGMPATCPAIDAAIWGLQMEVGAAYVSSYIPTTNAIAVRIAEAPSFTGSWAASPLSVAVSVAMDGTRAGYTALATLRTDNNNYVLLGQLGLSTSGIEVYSGGAGVNSSTTALASGDRVFGFSGAAGGPLVGGKGTTSGAAVTAPALVMHATFNIGTYGGANSFTVNGIVSGVCLSSDPSRCR